MPYRRLPNTDKARVRALKAAVARGDICSLDKLAISLKTLFEARNFLAKFELRKFIMCNAIPISPSQVANISQM